MITGEYDTRAWILHLTKSNQYGYVLFHHDDNILTCIGQYSVNSCLNDIVRKSGGLGEVFVSMNVYPQRES